MLTKGQRTNITICNEYLSNPGITLEKLAKKLQVSTQTINRAIKWGNEQGLFITDNSEKIRQNIIDLQSTLEILEREYSDAWREAKRRRKEQKRLNRIARENGKPTEDIKFGLSRTLSMLSKRILEYKTRIMELEGLYHKVIEFSGRIENNLSGPLLQMVVAIVDPKNGNGTGNNETGTNQN